MCILRLSQDLSLFLCFCRSKSRERILRSMDSATEILDSADLDASLQASLADAEASGSAATRSAVELSLDEDKVGSRQCLGRGQQPWAA